ncbi:MAG TPA: 16S rRNA (cytidine(1402)-2'-O)-methyltransferase [Acidimicrobiia bacterium]|nr:16S rRNA (cytidine(1402)-2'-O)-methyltransferase [Acidimicrobiia bacterium]
MPGRLILCATPIGNLGDASSRLGRVLDTADVIFAEDTRRSRTLLHHLGIKKPLRSYHAGNEAERSVQLGQMLAEGNTIALITDAGTPAISDPGLSAVAAARHQQAEVSVVPGPSAVTAALAVSGLPSDRFVFEGFLPRRSAARASRLAAMRAELRTMVLFVAPHHLLEDLQGLRQTLGDRDVAVARELSKAYEEVWWGTLGDAISEWSEREPQGEFTLVVAGGEEPPPDFEAAFALMKDLMAGGMTTGAAARQVAEATGIPRRTLYERAIREMA